MQSDPILILTWSWDCRVRRAEASLCPVFILNNEKKKKTLDCRRERERPDQSLDGSHLRLYFCCCVVLFVVLFL